MADDKRARDKQAHDAERRRQERDVSEYLEREDETEPPVDERELGDLEAEIESLSFPATGSEVVAAVGDREIESGGESHVVAELVPDAETETFETPGGVRARVRRPTVAAAMKRVVETGATLPNPEFGRSQREAYEKTFRALGAIDADDEDEGIRVVGDWIVEQIHEKETLPGSRAVRRRAAKFCRSNGYAVRNDEWLGV